MTTTWEQITEGTYVSADWRYTIERDGDQWLISERGCVVSTRSSLANAQAWVDGNAWVR